MLTETEKLQRAKMYMQKLANGINPIDDMNIRQDSALQNERLQKCFAYIAEVLDGNIKTALMPAPPPKRSYKANFTITQEQIGEIAVLDRECAVSELAAEINKVTVQNNCKKLTAKTINDWLAAKGYLQNVPDDTGKTRRELTDKSAEIGMTSRQGIGAFGEYTIVLYPPQTQRYILDNLPEIVNFIKEQ